MEWAEKCLENHGTRNQRHARKIHNSFVEGRAWLSDHGSLHRKKPLKKLQNEAKQIPGKPSETWEIFENLLGIPWTLLAVRSCVLIEIHHLAVRSNVDAVPYSITRH